MPSKVRDSSPERRRESSKRESSHKSEKADGREHRKSHRKSSTKDKASSKISLPTNESRRGSMPGNNPDTENVPRASDSKSSLPYPSFSKAHSKESVAPRPKIDIFTPPATDLNASKTRLASPKSTPVRNAPPSPPLTDRNSGRRRGSGGKAAAAETILEDNEEEPRDNKIKIGIKPESQKSDSRLRSTSELGANGSPVKARTRNCQSTPLKSGPQTFTPQRSVSQPTRTGSPGTKTAATETPTEISSNATSIAPEQPNVQRPGSRAPPAVVADDQRSEVTSMPGSFPERQPTPIEIQRPPVEVFVEKGQAFSARSTPAYEEGPPPPPPLAAPVIPKVDYLLQHGGLFQPVPRDLLLAGKPMAIQQGTPRQQPIMVAHLFQPYNQLLEDFEKVMSKNGSLAVATGYKSVARRLLDRLEKVFARDISSEACQCCMCLKNFPQMEDIRGVSWGEILELVSGRRDLPSWPPFTFVASPMGLGISLETHVPMQKLDIDVPDEYREHYIRQSRKTRLSVDKWLNRQTESPSSPPEEVDDETLTFAILTYLDPEQRSTLTNLLGIVSGPPEPPRRIPTPELGSAPGPQPTPQPRVRQEPIILAGHAIQRLYRLETPPRDPETALFMLNNSTLHNALATLVAVSNDEWDILVSGRFDGFLRSGADDFMPENIPPSQGRYTPLSKSNSRGPTPAQRNPSTSSYPYLSRNPTPSQPASYGAPVALDEETEFAVLASIERDIYTGMEALEDAFEALHLKAETVRRALRERSAGLATAQQRRRGPGAEVEVRMDTPANGGIASGGENWDGETETDDGLADWEAASEIAPDDSASNISSSRRRRPKRRHERRTPVVLEESEDSEGTESPRKR